MTAPLVSISWLCQNIQDPGLIILDASLKENKTKLKTEYDNVQIPGARHFDIVFPNAEGSSFPSAEGFGQRCRSLGINKNSTLIIYDNLGIYSAPRLWWMFKVMGHKKVAVLDGGLPAWAQSGMKTETPRETVHEEGNFKPDYQPLFIRKTEEVAKNLESEEFLLIDARTEGRFKGLAPEPGAGLSSGHIPKSVNLPFNKVLKNGKYLSKEELSKIFTGLSSRNKPLVFSCGSGVTACILILACEMVSESQKSLYNGSWTEYAQTEGLPIVKDKS